jgi:hypothetical protein
VPVKSRKTVTKSSKKKKKKFYGDQMANGKWQMTKLKCKVEKFSGARVKGKRE